MLILNTPHTRKDTACPLSKLDLPLFAAAPGAGLCAGIDPVKWGVMIPARCARTNFTPETSMQRPFTEERIEAQHG